MLIPPMLTFSSPQLTPTFAHFLSFTFSAIYVGSIYVSSKTRLSFNNNHNNNSTGHSSASASTISASSTTSTNGRISPREKLKDERWRDDPDVIKARLVAVSIASFACCTAVHLVLHTLSTSSHGGADPFDTLTRLGFGFHTTLPSLSGWSWRGLWEFSRPHLITPVLFFGPLYATWLGRTLPGQKFWSWEEHVRQNLWTWQGIRNVLVAPPTEEIVFRGCILSILHLSGVSKAQLLFLSPLSFGLAHAHHAWDTFNRYGRTSQAALRALTTTLFQLTYTTLFGCYTSYLFLRTSSIYPPISAHMFCNFMGFPRIGYELGMFPRQRTCIITAYVIGMVTFIYVLPKWTLTPESIYWMRYLQEVKAGGKGVF